MYSHISPSLICMDLLNLESEVRKLEAVGCEMLHLDLLDGYFSPSMPIGLDTIRQLRAKTNMAFDAHVMAIDNTYMVEELVDIGVSRLCFQVETERHISRKLLWIKSQGVQAGVALSPATSISTLEYVLEQCDFVLLMMINPGYASNASEKVVPGAIRKISDLHRMILEKQLDTTITIDGKTFLDVIPGYIHSGVETIVAGTSSLFRNNGKALQENYAVLKQTMDEALGKRSMS